MKAIETKIETEICIGSGLTCDKSEQCFGKKSGGICTLEGSRLFYGNIEDNADITGGEAWLLTFQMEAKILPGILCPVFKHLWFFLAEIKKNQQ